MNMIRLAFAVSAITLATGCTILPDYRAPQGTAVARVNLKGEGKKWICVSGQRFGILADSTGYADIPADGRLTIGSKYNAVIGEFIVSCNPRASIIPVPGGRYYVDFEIEAEKCYTTIFKEDPESRTGLALDATFGQSSDCFGSK